MFDELARRRRAREMERRLQELDRWDELYGVGATPPVAHAGRGRRGGRRGPRRRGRRGLPVGWLLVAGVVVGGLAFPERSMALLGQAGDLVSGVRELAQGGGDGGPAISFGTDVGARSTESLWAPPGGDRVLPPVAVTGEGEHEFLSVQPGTGEPVGFSPCGVIEVEVNPDGAPEAYPEIVSGSLARLSAASGLSLQLTGTSEARFDDPRAPGDPVLVSWADEQEMPELAGTVAGYGGPLIVTDGVTGERWLSSGAAVIDRDGVPEGSVGAVLDHELGHVLGLGHVDAPEELMAPMFAGQEGFGAGDLEGLARLGAIGCP